jgi:excisionase family DNA binding protein
MTDRLWLTVADAARHAAVSRDTIYTACERGELRHVRVGGRRSIRLRAEWIDAWLEQGAREPRSPVLSFGRP